ncbi:MAG: transposase [Planctomycetota bacterium]
MFDKALLGRGFLAHILVERFGNHMPYHRPVKKYSAEGLDLQRSTLQRSTARAADLLEPIWEQLRKDVLASPAVHTDDTPVTIARGSEGGSRKGPARSMTPGVGYQVAARRFPRARSARR